MIISTAQPHQADELSRLSQAAKATWGYPASQLLIWQADLIISPASILSNPTYVATEYDQILGFCQLTMGDIAAELAHLWVAPTHMRKGIGRSLLAQASQHAQRDLFIDADPHAAPFYQACGCEEVARTPAPIEGEPQRYLPRMVLAVPPLV